MFGVTVPGFGIGHLLRQDASEFFTDLRHHIGRRNGNVELGEAGLDAIDQILVADDVGAGLLRGLGVIALAERNDANRTARSVRQAAPCRERSDRSSSGRRRDECAPRPFR